MSITCLMKVVSLLSQIPPPWPWLDWSSSCRQPKHILIRISKRGIIDAHGGEGYPEVMQGLSFPVQLPGNVDDCRPAFQNTCKLTKFSSFRPYRPRCWLEGGEMMTSNTSEIRILVSELELLLPGKEWKPFVLDSTSYQFQTDMAMICTWKSSITSRWLLRNTMSC